MVIVEKQDDGTTILRGRSPRNRVHVPWWPCSEGTIRTAAMRSTSESFIKECAAVADDARQLKD